jgi:antitoxin component YwqK of YwqJK toxin-antitoxin module
MTAARSPVVVALFVLAASGARAAARFPPECSTLPKCAESRNEAGELDGSETCVNAYKPSVKVIEAHWSKGKLSGRFWCAADDGTPRLETTFQDGLAEGEYRTRWNAKLKAWDSIETMRHGARAGLTKQRGADGNWNVAFYEADGKQHGATLHVDASGRVLNMMDCAVHGRRARTEDCSAIAVPGYEKALSAYLAGEKSMQTAAANRTVVQNWPNGKPEVRYRLVDGRIEGRRESFFEDGKPELTTDYAHGQKNGTETEHFPEGQVRRVAEFREGKAVSETVFYQNGRKKTETASRTPSGKNVFVVEDVKEYWDNGHLRLKGTRIDDSVWDGDYAVFNEDGTPASSGRYARGRETGTWHVYGADAELERTYADGVLQKELVFTPTGRKLVRTREFMPDGSIKSDAP